MEIVPAVNQVETHVFNQQTEPQKSSAHASCRGDRSPRAVTVSSRIQYLPKSVANMGKHSTDRSALVNPTWRHHHPQIDSHRTDATKHRHFQF